MSSADVKLAESKNSGETYYYLAGRGQSVQPNASRRLEDGILPILHSTLLDDGIEYYTTSFVSLESSPLNAGYAHWQPLPGFRQFQLRSCVYP